MPTAHALLATYRDDIAHLPPDIAAELRDAAEAYAVAQRDADEANARLDLAIERDTAAHLRVDLYIAERNAILLDALHVKLDPTGTPVPRQGAPRGPRQRLASAGDPPPAMQAGNEVGAVPEAVQAFYDAVQDRAPAAELEALGWMDGGEGLSDVQTRTLCKHQITPDEVTSFVFGGVIVRGTTWTMDDAARVVA
jgi:hypothetical protein